MVTVSYCSRSHNETQYIHLRQVFGKDAEIIENIIDDPQEGLYLTKSYNDVIRSANSDIVVLIHDDATFEADYVEKNIENRIRSMFDKNPDYGILGVIAYCDNSIVDQPMMDSIAFIHAREGEHFNRGWLEPYSEDVKQEILLDGVFLAIKKDRIKKLFNEDNRGFDFYDIEFCFENYLEGVKAGACKAFKLWHRSYNNWDGYMSSRDAFIEKYKDILPITF